MSQVSKLTRVQRLVADRFQVRDTRWDGIKLIFFVRLDPATVEGAFEQLRRELKPLGLIPMLRAEQGPPMLVVTPKPPMEYRSTRVNLVMLLLTILTTIWVGSIFWMGYTDEEPGELSIFTVFWHPRLLFMGALTFALPLLTILGVHEMGHYVMARRHGLEASLPFFIPMPPPFLLGTMGAFISIREPIPNRKALLDIGVAGPIAGFLMALPVTLLGLLLTEYMASPVPEDTGSLTYLGTPLIFMGLDSVSQLLLPATGSYLIHPVAFAGWAGFLVTALNLLPAGQLDGGHIARALLGDKAQHATTTAMGLMLFLGLFGVPGTEVPPYTGWVLFAALIYMLGLSHPPPLEDVTALDPRRVAAGGFALFMLVASFVPAPLYMGESPYEYELHTEAGKVELNQTQLAALNRTLVYDFRLDMVGEKRDNFSFRLLEPPEPWAVHLKFNASLLNASLLNASQVAELDLMVQPGDNLTFQLLLTYQGNLTQVQKVQHWQRAFFTVTSLRGEVVRAPRLNLYLTPDEPAGGS